jgi:hypothetical protein
MESDDVPARLREITGKSGRLPRPLALRLISELESSEWLRAEAVAAWEEIDVEAAAPDQRVSALFLLRPPEWEDGLREAVEGHGTIALTAQQTRLTAALDLSKGQIQELKGRLAAAEAGAADRISDAIRTRQQTVVRAEQALKKAKAEIKALKAAVEEMTSRLEAAKRHNQELAARLDELQERLEKQRRRPSAPAAEGMRWMWPPRGPLQLAAALDELVDVSPIPTPTSQLGAPPQRTTLPLGVRPDRAEAVLWLLSLPIAVTVIVDGWNAAYALARGEPDDIVRRRLLVACSQLRSRAAGRLRPVVLFDSSLEFEQFSADGTDVRYVPNADQAAVDLVGSIEGLAVVISSDRAVRNGAEALGALALWSEALVGWIEGSR